MSAATACLCLPTRDGPEELRRALESYRPLVSCYAISLDPHGPIAEQREVIADVLAGMHGSVTVDTREGHGAELHQLVTDAGQVVAAEHGATWLLVVHGDDWMRGDGAWPTEGDAWCIETEDVANGGRVAHRYAFPRLLRAGLPWRWVGRAHELPTLNGEPAGECASVPGLVYVKPWKDRGGSQTEWRGILMRDLEDSGPSGPAESPRVPWLYARSTFYVAQTYAGEALTLDGAARAEAFAEASRWHERRAAMEYGGAEERGVAAYYAWKHGAASRGEMVGDVAGGLDAAEMLPGRPEPLFDIAVGLRAAGRMSTAWLFASHAWRLAQRGGWRGGMFADVDVCEWRSAALAAALACEVGEMSAGYMAAMEAAERCPGGSRGRALADGESSEVELWVGQAGRYAEAIGAMRAAAAGGGVADVDGGVVP